MSQKRTRIVPRIVGLVLLLVLSLALIYYSVLISRLEAANEAFRRGEDSLAHAKYLQVLSPFHSLPLMRTLLRSPYQTALFNYVQLLYAQGKYPEVVEILEKEASQFPYLAGTASYRLWMGNALFRTAILQGNKDNKDQGVGVEALQSVSEEYDKAIEVDRLNWDAKYNYEFVKQLLAKQTSKDAKDKETLHLLLGELRMSSEQRQQQRPEKLQ